MVFVEWRTFDHIAIDHKPLTAREQWENSRHWLALGAMISSDQLQHW